MVPKEILAVCCCAATRPADRVIICYEVEDCGGCTAWRSEHGYTNLKINPGKTCQETSYCQAGGVTKRYMEGEAPPVKETPLKPPELQINIPGFHGFTTEEEKIKKCAECKDPDVMPEDCPPEKCARWVYEIPWIGEYLIAIYKWSVGAIAILAVVMIMIHGVRWLIAGGEAPKISEAKKGITYAVTGLIFILLTHQILSLIDPRLTIFKPITIGMIKKIEVDYEPPPAKPGEFVEEELWKFSSLTVKNQTSDASDVLTSFMNCTGNKIKTKSGGKKATITSISDTAGISNCLPANYKKPPCSHSLNSCHYGGRKCSGKSYALDVWAQGEVSPETIIEAIKECQPKAFICYTPKTPACSGHYSHIHVSIGKINGCDCN
ncbi:MAG: pilin [Patescibacteria group bacterium]|nr:pilin [Patescibacteria group bacterium]